jgi:leucine efflux protein
VLGTVNLPEYAVGALLIILLPGPNSLYVLSVAARRGTRAGYRAAAGVFLGDSTLITLTSLGAASLLARRPVAFDTVKYLGAAYLAFLGAGMLRSSVRSLRARHTDASTHGAATDRRTGRGTAAGTPAERPFRRALLVSLLNPKAILFFLAFFTQFVKPNYAHPVVPYAVLAAIVQCYSATYLSALILGGSRLADTMRRRRRLSASMTGGVGTLFLGFAAKLATATLR